MNQEEALTDDVTREGEYVTRGDYHRNLDPNWSFYPIYIATMKYVRKYIRALSKEAVKILDAGCGEGVLVEEFSEQGYDIIGLDANYSSKYVMKGYLHQLPFDEETFSHVLLLAVLEHLNFADQEQALSQLWRVLKPNGIFILSVPNLAHLYSRISFLIKGQLHRTAAIKKHPGDRPICEYHYLLKKHGFKICKVKGFFPTIPILFNIMVRHAKRFLWLYKTINYFAYPNLCFLNLMVCQKVPLP